MTRRAAAAGDAGLYAASALVAVVVPLTTDVPLDSEWARIAAPVYTTGALAAMVQAARGATTRSRAMLAAAVFAAVVVVPLIAHAEARAEGGSAEHVKSDVLVRKSSKRSCRQDR